jgi:uncharacterized membrane protein YgcG
MHVPRRRTLLITPLAALAVATAGAPAMALAGGGKSGDRPQSSGKSTDRGGGKSAGGGTGHRIR